MSPNPQFPADLVTFTGNFISCAVKFLYTEPTRWQESQVE